MTSFGKLIRRARRKAKLTQADLARQIGVGTRSVISWEQEKNFPKPKTLRLLADKLQIPELLAHVPAKRPGNSLPALIWNARITARLTQAELAERMGVSDRSIRLWESGEGKPTPEHLQALAKIIDLPEVSE